MNITSVPRRAIDMPVRIGLLVLVVAAVHDLAAQTTPGRLFRTAVNNTQLDPNGDGWVSATTNGFSNLPDILDESQEFETEWEPLWHYEMEPNSDLQTGSDCGPTEIVDNPNLSERAGYWKVIDPDGTSATGDELLLFRIRINSDPNNAAYGYSFLLDTDRKFGTSGIDADPNAMPGNPGFEFEILFASGNAGGVYVNKVDGIAAHNQITVYQSYADGVNDQRSYARFSNCAPSTPIFIDFFVAFADFGAEVQSNTPLRLLFATASSANSALNGSASDIGGINDANYPDDDAIFEAFISAVPVIQFSEGYVAPSTTPNINGCTDPAYAEYDANANTDDGSCATLIDPCDGALILGSISLTSVPTAMDAADGEIAIDITTGTATALELTGINGAGDYSFSLPGATDGILPGTYDASALDAGGCNSNTVSIIVPYAQCCNGCGVYDVDTDGICDDSDNCTDRTASNYADPANGACIFD